MTIHVRMEYSLESICRREHKEQALTVDCGAEVRSVGFAPCGSKIAAACGDDVKILKSQGSGSVGTFVCESTLTGHRYVPSL